MKCLPMLFGPLMPFEGQLKQQPSFLVSKGTKYSKYPNNSLLAYCSIFFFLLLIVSCLLGSQTCWWPLNSVCVCVCVCTGACVRVSLPQCPAAACAPLAFCHVIIFSPVLLIDYLSSGWKVEFCFTRLANSEFSLRLCFTLMFSVSILLVSLIFKIQDSTVMLVFTSFSFSVWTLTLLFMDSSVVVVLPRLLGC